MTPIKVLINCLPDAQLQIQQWPIDSTDSMVEHNRISIQALGYSYSLVLDSSQPRLEVWAIDENSDPVKIISSLNLPKK